MPCTNSLFNGTFSSPNQMVKVGGRGGGDQIIQGGTIYFSWKEGDQMFQWGKGGGGPFFSENIGPPGPFFFLKYLVWGGDQLLSDSSFKKTFD